MTTLSEALEHARAAGFTLNFRVTETGLTWDDRAWFYFPEEVKIVNFYRFEGDSDPAGNCILYLIETSGGERGTLTEAYGAYADEHTGEFIKAVEKIRKQMPR